MSRPGPTTITISGNQRDVRAYATRKARYGHKIWVVWQGRCGTYHAGYCTSGTLKAAVLCAGPGLLRANFGQDSPNNDFTIIHPSFETWVNTWGIALNVLRQSRAGHL